MRHSVALFMSNTHKSVNEASASYLQNERRYNYTTPKSFLEQIKLYRNLLSQKHSELLKKMQRLENGLEKLKSTATQVSKLLHQFVSCFVFVLKGSDNSNVQIIQAVKQIILTIILTTLTIILTILTNILITTFTIALTITFITI